MTTGPNQFTGAPFSLSLSSSLSSARADLDNKSKGETPKGFHAHCYTCDVYKLHVIYIHSTRWRDLRALVCVCLFACTGWYRDRVFIPLVNSIFLVIFVDNYSWYSLKRYYNYCISNQNIPNNNCSPFFWTRDFLSFSIFTTQRE